MGITMVEATRNALADALVDLCDVGSADATGDLVIMAGGDVAVATLALSATAFGAASGGVATAAEISDDTNAAGGEAVAHKFQNRDNVEVWRGTTGTSGSDLNLSSTSINPGDTVSVSAYTVTMPAS